MQNLKRSLPAIGLIVFVSIFVLFVRSTSENKVEVSQVADPVATETIPAQENSDLQELRNNIEELNRDLRAYIDAQNAKEEASESEITEVAENIPEPVVVVDEEVIIDCGNSQFISTKGYRGADVVPCGGLWLVPNPNLREGVYYRKRFAEGTAKFRVHRN